jgi:predicted transcriptional regulator
MQDIGTRRDRHQIVAEILETARGGSLRTHILFKAKLSYDQLNEYLPLLVEKGFLEDLTIVRNRQTKHLLKTTRQGEQFLQNYRALNL